MNIVYFADHLIIVIVCATSVTQEKISNGRSINQVSDCVHIKYVLLKEQPLKQQIILWVC